MHVYSVMLEGIDVSMGYFMVAVAARRGKLAKKHAQDLGQTFIGDGTKFKFGAESLSMSGKSYFPRGH